MVYGTRERRETEALQRSATQYAQRGDEPKEENTIAPFHRTSDSKMQNRPTDGLASACFEHDVFQMFRGDTGHEGPLIDA